MQRHDLKRRRRQAVSRFAAGLIFGIGLLTRAHADDIPAKPAAPSAAPTVDLSKDRVLYLIGYSHLDTEWCWNYPQVISEFIPNTLHENFALFDKYPDYVFNWTGANRYRFMKEYYPDDYARLKKYIAAGRWVTNGSSLEEGDVCLPSPESIIRQVMYGNQFFRREFGTSSNEYMLPDCFGFPASLPTLLTHCGITGFSTQKLTWGSAVGIPFNVGRWVGPDGSSVVAALNGGAYDQKVTEDLSQSKYWLKRIEANGAKSGVFADYSYYGAGDRGGSPGEASVQWVDRSVKGTGPVRVVASKAGDLFSQISPEQVGRLPTYKGDLLLTQHSSGTASSEAAMKRWNRRNEYLGDSAERASVAASLLGAESYPKQRITDGWLRFLPGQFHDIMAGTALPQSYDYAWNDQIIALNTFADVTTQAVGGVARALDTRVQGIPLIVYNPLSRDRESLVEAEVTFPGKVPNAVRVFGPDGKEVPAQITARTGVAIAKILFAARVPSVGFAVYDVRPASNPQNSPLKVAANLLENARYRVRLDSHGDVASVYDKSAQRELLSGPARLAFQSENPSQFPAWNMDWSDQQKPPRGYVSGPAAVRIVENGPARVALEVTRETEGSRFIQTIRLASGSVGNRVEFATKIDWRSQGAALKAVFPLTVSNPMATYNWGVGTVQRGSNDPRKYEVPTHEWFDLTDTSGKYGVAVLNDSKYGSDKPDDNTVRLTLLYTPGTRGGYQHQGTQDWGRHEMVYALEGHRGDWRSGDTQAEAASLNQPLAAFQTPAHAGALGKSFSLVRVSSPHVAVAALKQAEDSDEIVVRLFERDGQAAPGLRLSMAAPITAVREVNGQEQAMPRTDDVRLQKGTLVCDMAAYRPRAFALRLGRPSVRLTAPAAVPLSLPFNTDVASLHPNQPGNGAFDAQGRSLPGELLPDHLESGGVPFRLAATTDGGKNAVACAGQVLPLPKAANGTPRRVYLLAAAYGDDTPATFHLDKQPVTRTIQDWSGFVGRWDYRLWKGKVPELTYGWDNPLGGLLPGYIKRDPIAWYADHWRLANGKNDPYRFCYVFRYALDVPAGARTLTLPNNPKVRVLAATVSDNPNDTTPAAAPLYDTLADHVSDTAPTIVPASGNYSDAVSVQVHTPLYFNDMDNASGGELRYTLDGSEPGPRSPRYSGTVTLTQTATLKVRQVGLTTRANGPVCTARFIVNDKVAPTITAVSAIGLHAVRVVFSEPVTKPSAEDPSHYRLAPSLGVKSARLGDDTRTVLLATKTALPQTNSGFTLTIDGVRDRSTAGNSASHVTKTIALLRPVFRSGQTQTLTGVGPGPKWENVPNLPVRGGSPWTLNQFVYMDNQPEELTILGGFGDGTDTSGAQRYLVKFHNGIHFWGSNVDINAGEPFALGRWQMISVTYDGSLIRLYRDGKLLKTAPANFSNAVPVVKIGRQGPWNEQLFAGKIADLTIWNEALPADFLQTLLPNVPASLSLESKDPTMKPALAATAAAGILALQAHSSLAAQPVPTVSARASATPVYATPVFVADTSEVPDLHLEAWGRVAEALCTTWYPKVSAILHTDDTTRTPLSSTVRLIFKPTLSVPAYASGGNLYLNGAYIKSHLDDYGMIVHELTHLVQRYPEYKPSWLVEGIADWVRGYSFEPELTHPRINFAKANYTDAYKTTAAFLQWASLKYDKDLVPKLSIALASNTYQDDLFKQYTGKDAPTLWAEFVASQPAPAAPKPAESVAAPKH